jgi:hypothetical protein
MKPKVKLLGERRAKGVKMLSPCTTFTIIEKWWWINRLSEYQMIYVGQKQGIFGMQLITYTMNSYCYLFETDGSLEWSNVVC